MSKKAFYITTPIYYPSGDPHIGHAYCTVLADILARFKRMEGLDVYFLTGTDEHGLKIEKNAKKDGITPQEYVDIKVASFKKLWEALKITNDDFIRTTEERHIECVQKVFSDFVKNDDVYLGKYEGWYCVPCESFWTETQVGEDHICPDCGRPVERATEECYFFKTKKYLKELEGLFEKEKFITPISRKNEMVNTFIKPGLEDLCVSRTSFSWGVPILEKEGHVAYVWLDALINYISALGYRTEDDSLFKKFWQNEDCEIVHLVGADITRFHTIYWPEFLSALNLRHPDRVFVHGLLMMKDGKMSKSKGNVISPYPLIEKYGLDTVRYYLAREMVFGSDGTFTPEQFVERVNQDLVNNFGNLVSRTLSMINKYFDGIVPNYKRRINQEDDELDSAIENTISSFVKSFDDLDITNGIIKIMDLADRANKYIEQTAPWVLSKDETKKENLESVMAHLARVIFVTTKLLEPIVVEKSQIIYDNLGLSLEEREFENIKNEHLLDCKKVVKGEILFPRLDVLKEVEYIKSLMASK